MFKTIVANPLTTEDIKPSTDTDLAPYPIPLTILE